MATSLKGTSFLIERRRRDAARGDAAACYDLGVCYSTGTSGVTIDLIEAHKWFNIAAVSGLPEAAGARADIAEDMTAREIATAQRAARDWLGINQRRAA
jgi:uncharacterized protein